jgi:hypothetical protein
MAGVGGDKVYGGLIGVFGGNVALDGVERWRVWRCSGQGCRS